MLPRFNVLVPALLAGVLSTPAIAVEVVTERFAVGDSIYVRSMAVDAENNSLWVGTSTGVSEIDLATQAPLRTFTRDDGLANEYVFAIGIDSRGYKWFGTNAGGVSRYKDGEMKTYFPLHGLADYWIYAFAEQREGPFWIGTWAGANSFDLETGEFKTYIEQLINEWVYAIGVDSRDRVWFGTEGGITMLDGRTWEHWTHDDGLGAPNERQLPASANAGLGTKTRHDLNVLVGGVETYNPNYVFSLVVDDNDVVWAGTWGGGVSRLENGQWSYLTEEDGLAGNIVYSMAQADDGVLWFGTNRGLSRYDDGNWTNYGVAEGLFQPDVYAIAIAPDGGVWAGTRDGVVLLSEQTR